MEMQAGGEGRSNLFRITMGMAEKELARIRRWYARFILGMAIFGLFLPWATGRGFDARDPLGYERAVILLTLTLEAASLGIAAVASRRKEREATDELRAKTPREDGLSRDLVEVLFVTTYLDSRNIELRWLQCATCFAAMTLSFAGGPWALSNMASLLLFMWVRLPAKDAMGRWAAGRAAYLPLWPVTARREG